MKDPLVSDYLNAEMFSKKEENATVHCAITLITNFCAQKLLRSRSIN